jgi:2-polyprenyl-6-methoxyphenol hydroxylase-like FAD-dependent oxidoreductase
MSDSGALVAYPTTPSGPRFVVSIAFVQGSVKAVGMSDSKATMGNHAVVLRASMAGLLAARSLAGFYHIVTVVGRDPLPDTDDLRRSVPQGRHLHARLVRGAQVVEELFPGVLDELVLDGAQYFDGRDLSRLHYNVGGHLAARSGGAGAFTAYCVTRPFLEGHVRRRVRDIPNVTHIELANDMP